jgi:signal peptidase I
VIRTFLFQPFSIPSGSMRPTLLEGDYLFVTKWAYGYSRHSLPVLARPVLRPHLGRRAGARRRRRVQVPAEPSLDYIKRVIGLPGDRIQMVAASCSSTASRCRAKRPARSTIPTSPKRPPGRRLSRDAAERRDLRHARPDAEFGSATTRANLSCRRATIS